MSTGLFSVLEREMQGIDAGSVGGKFLSRNLEWLDDVARKLSVLPLSEFVSISPTEAAAFLVDEEADAAQVPLPPEQWFDPAQGLKTIDVLLQQTQSQKPGESGLLQDLTACRHVLRQAQQNNVRFHFSVDF